MTPQQNPFANAEEARKYMELDVGHCVKKYAIIPTVMNMLGDVRGSKILDVGCGYGLVSKMLADKGVEVVGIDASEEMIKLAQDVSKSELASFYHVQAEKMPKLENYMFDDAISILVLNYVSNRKNLERIFSNVYENLRFGGKFISFQNQIIESGFNGGRANSDRTYERIPSLQENPNVPRFRFTRTVGDKEVSLELTDWSFSDYETAARDAGFKRIRRCETMVSLEGIRSLSQDYWANYAKTNIFHGFEATK